MPVHIVLRLLARSLAPLCALVVIVSLAARALRGADRSSAELADATRVETAHLSLYPANPRRGHLDAIKESLEVNGQYRPLVVNRRTMQVLAGNHTLLAARELGWRQIAVAFVDVDEAQARRIVLADNRTLATYGLEALLELLGSAKHLGGTGYDQAALDDLLDELAPPPLEEEDVSTPPAEPRTRPGQLLALGPHRLACGDARDPEAYKALLGTESGHAMWTDPPYGVDYEGRTRSRLRLDHDWAQGLPELLASAFARVDAALWAGAPLYVARPSAPRARPSSTRFWARAGCCARS